ncbi:MAG TPA: GspH/FimT family pseudopilin [Rudaea sp.]|nr:GspH/FimT family pseudopilin [Rudaea sp.]
MRKQSGFTLIEALVTMTVAVILTAMAAPSFKLTFQNNRMISQSNDLLGALVYARSEAIELNQNVTICASSDGKTCGTSWAQGWIVCQDDDATPPGVTDCSGASTVLRVHGALSGNNTLTSTFGGSVVFQKSGTTTATGDGTFSICDSRGAGSGSSLWLTLTGLARLSTTPGKMIDGNALTC